MFLLLLIGMAAWRSFKRIPGPLQLLLLLLPLGLVVTGQNIEVNQLPEKISVKAGENLTLKCTWTGGNLPVSVRWHKTKDRSQALIYENENASNRGIRIFPRSNTDFSIIIQNIRPEDDGTYYCVTFRPGTQYLVWGKGTLVSVIAEPSRPVVLGPTRRITAGSRASFNCSTGGFSPREITVSWLKDGKKIPSAHNNILDSDEKQSILYRAESMVEIPLEQGDVKSQLTCQIQHRSLESLLQQTFALGDVLRVPPKVRLETYPSSPVQLNASVMVTCNAESFYPENATMELFPKDAQSRKGKVGVKTSNPDGTFTLKTNLEMMATEERNHSMFLCQVQHDSQPLINESITLSIRMQPEDNRILSDDSGIGGRPNPMSQEAVTITAGNTLTLKCTLTQKDIPASAEWYKDLGNDQKIIYRESDKFSPGARLIPGSPTDFTVQLYNIRPEDSGTYCCSVVKEDPQSRNPIKTKTVVSVIAHPSQPLLRGPTDSIAVGSQVSFNCSAKEFPSQEITVVWLKDKEEIQPAGTDVLNYTTNEGIRYRMETTVDLSLREEDMGSVLSCQVRHSSLEDSLQQDLVLGKVIRGTTQNSPTSLWIALFLNKAGILLLISFLFLMKACKCNCARNPSGSSQEAKQSGKPG